nr:LINE-type retrotransposon LIb DNA [Ipomoea batatas]
MKPTTTTPLSGGGWGGGGGRGGARGSGVLASDPEEEVNALNSKDAEPAPRESSKGSKGKSPSIPNYSRQTPNQGKPPENRPRNREMPASSSKGRGGSQTAFRGKGRGQGRNGSSNQPRRATLNEWFDHLGSDGVFQFGRSQPSTSGQERDNGTFTGSAQPLRIDDHNLSVLAFITEQRQWDVRSLEQVLPANLVDQIRAIPISINPNQEDSSFMAVSNLNAVRQKATRRPFRSASAIHLLAGTDPRLTV